MKVVDGEVREVDGGEGVGVHGASCGTNSVAKPQAAIQRGETQTTRCGAIDYATVIFASR